MVSVDGAAVVPRHVEFNFYNTDRARQRRTETQQCRYLVVISKHRPVRELTVIALTSREEPVGVLNDRLDDANDLEGNRCHHLRNVSVNEAEVFDKRK